MFSSVAEIEKLCDQNPCCVGYQFMKGGYPQKRARSAKWWKKSMKKTGYPYCMKINSAKGEKASYKKGGKQSEFRVKVKHGCSTVATCPSGTPADPCDQWKKSQAANAQLAAALKSEINFKPDNVAIEKRSFGTLANVARILKSNPWMSILVQGHSSAQPGPGCQGLVNGRAASTQKWLRKLGVKNNMPAIPGTCAVKRAITIVSTGPPFKAPPKCRL